MKHFILAAICLLGISHTMVAQSKLQVVHDTVRIINAELSIGNSSKSVQGYLYNVGNGVTQFRVPVTGKNIQFKIGDTGYPAAGDTSFTDTGLINRTIKVWRNGLLQYRDLSDGVVADSVTGKVVFHPALNANDRIYVEALNNVAFVFKISSTPSFNTNLTGLNSGVFDNGNNTFTLRWATNNKTLTVSPRVLGLGSSTLGGTGLSFPDRLGDKIGAWLSSNTSGSTWINLAVGGYSSSSVLPSNLGGVAGHNIDSALNANPDFLFVSLPTNDPGAGIPVAQTMNNFRRLDTMALNRGIIIFWETSQPRTSYGAPEKAQLRLLADSVRNAWPTRYVEGFNDVVDPTSVANIKSEYAQGDGIHLTKDGNQFIANSLFSRWQNYFIPITGVSGYVIETSTDGQTWSQLDNVSDPSVVKKTYNRPDNQVHYYRIKAQYTNGTVSAYSNISRLSNGNTSTLPPPVTSTNNRILIDFGGDGLTTKNGTGAIDGRPTPSPDSLGKYWNNWSGKGGTAGFSNGAVTPNLVTVTNRPTSVSLALTGNPGGTFSTGSGTTAINYSGFTSGAGDYPGQALYDNMFVHSSVGTNGVSLAIRGLDRTNTYTVRLWGARIDAATTPRALETKLGTQIDWSASKSFDARYAASSTPNLDKAIVYTNITGVDSLVLNLRVLSGSTFGHISFIDIAATDSVRDVNAVLSLVADTSVTLPQSSIQLTGQVSGPAVSGYQWTQLSGPSTTTFSNPTSASTTIQTLTNGIYTYSLTATTTSGAQFSKTVNVSVYPNNNGLKTMRVNFSLTQAPPIPGWFNAFGSPTGTQLAFTDPATSWTIDNGGSTTAYWNPFDNKNASDNAGQTAGNNSGVVPDIALNNYWYNSSSPYVSGTNNLIISNLNPAKTYTLTLVASRSSSVAPPRYASWHINNGGELLLNASGNTANKTVVNNVQPDGSGKINIGVYSPSATTTNGAFSYMNALIVQEN